jgi:autotransporter passenger strand-loop-strand repeat protein
MPTIIVDSDAPTVVSTSIPPTTNYIVEGIGTLDIVSGGFVSGLITISAGGTVNVSSGGTTLDTLVSSGGLQQVINGGIAIDTVVESVFDVFSEGFANFVTIGSNGRSFVDGAGTEEENTAILFGGQQIVQSGGFAFLTAIDSGGTQENFGQATLDGTTISSGGMLFLSSAGTALFTTNAGTEDVSLGGITSSPVVVAGGLEVISSGGTAISATIEGGTLELNGGSVAVGPIAFAATGGTLQIDSASTPSNRITGFVPSDRIVLTDVSFDLAGHVKLFLGNILTVLQDNQAYSLEFDSTQNFDGWHFKLSENASGNTVIALAGQRDDFNLDRTSDILFRDDTSGDTWVEAISNGGFKSWNQIGGSSTSFAEVGVGDFYGTGTADALFRNTSTGDTWIETISNDGFVGWNQIGGSDTNYSVVGVGDFFGNGTDDILFRNNLTGDTWFEAISNGASAGWTQIGGSDTNYAAVGIGNFFETGTDDILFRNNSTGDTWIEQISNGIFDGWHQIGGSDTHYAVVGVGDFFDNGTDDILFRNNSTGDTWIEGISNGAFKTWQQVGGSDTTYAVAGVGDYFGNGTDDILFRNNSTGDTWIEAINNGNGIVTQFTVSWQHVGGSDTSYTVKT